uniref:1,4-alpha-glucan branching protein GlgB n=1 Tax=Paraperibacillus marinus TaxID=3115295 RepID=UPI003F57C352
MAIRTPTDFELHLFHEGNLFKSHELFGSHLIHEGGRIYTRFNAWAPHARRIAVVGSFNAWSSSGWEMERVNGEGVWSLFYEGDLTGEIYKYEIITQDGRKLLKADPFAFYSELRPATASKVYSLDGYDWNDTAWQKKKAKQPSQSRPMFIYEMHFGSWKIKEDGSYFTYLEMVDELIPYLKETGYTHVELLPIIEHPFDGSWGYQGTGYYSATSRYGSPHELMYFVDQCHQHDIGVILDWVPGHFCKDAHGLYLFDGEPLFDYPTEKHRENRVWGTANFDLGRNEVQSFLISNACFWMDYFHIDGFRLDAVANIIYWPGGANKEVNSFGVAFLRKLNTVLLEQDPHLLIIAEDSSDYPQVTGSPEQGGLGFTYKWNMGWMNDMLEYMKAQPHERPLLHNKVTFSLMYAFTEQFVLPFSHDEVVHGKKSLLDKMPGSYEEKFAQLRLLLGFMAMHPGKQLLFMGSEFGQFREWSENRELDWNLFDYEMHRKLYDYVKELLKFSKRQKALYEMDYAPESFEWIDVNNSEQSIFSFLRKGKDEDLVCLFNFSPRSYQNYKIGVPEPGEYREVLNSDHVHYGGNENINRKSLTSAPGDYHGRQHFIEITVPAFGTAVFKKVKKRKGKKANGEDEMRSNVTGRRTRKPAQ